MERSKPAGPAAPEQDAKPSSSSTASGKSDTNTVPAATRNASSEERVRDLERRLGALDSGEKNTSVATITNTLIVDTATSAIPAQESDASSTAPSSPNPLLVRTCPSRCHASCLCLHPSLIITCKNTQFNNIETNPGRPRTCTDCGAEGKKSKKSCGRRSQASRERNRR